MYAEAILVAALRQNGARVTELAEQYAHLAGASGRASASRALREYELAMPTRGEDTSEDDAMRNRAAGRLLVAARDALK